MIGTITNVICWLLDTICTPENSIIINTIKSLLKSLEPSNKVLYEIKEFKQKRTLSQNSYLWKLVNELANKLNISKEELYLNLLNDYGQSEIVSILSEINPKGYFKYYKEIGTGIVNGKEFKHYKIYKGSSEMTTLEMKYLLDGVIQECENVGIPTLTKNEIEKMRLI